jgi:hypothetical protein
MSYSPFWILDYGLKKRGSVNLRDTKVAKKGRREEARNTLIPQMKNGFLIFRLHFALFAPLRFNVSVSPFPRFPFSPSA